MFEKSAAYYDALYSWKDYPGEAAMIHSLVQQHCPGARTLLDVACGTGKHLELLREHYEVEGVDLDANLLEIAEERNPGVAFHAADMVGFDLDRTFGVVVCLFSSIGYVQTEENLQRATAALARHVAPGGVLLIEPWLSPDVFEVGHIGLLVVDEPELKIVRMNESRRDGNVSVLEFHYLISEKGPIEHLRETHRLGLFTEEQHLDALREAGLEVRPPTDLRMGRGLYVAIKPR